MRQAISSLKELSMSNYTRDLYGAASLKDNERLISDILHKAEEAITIASYASQSHIDRLVKIIENITAHVKDVSGKTEDQFLQLPKPVKEFIRIKISPDFEALWPFFQIHLLNQRLDDLTNQLEKKSITEKDSNFDIKQKTNEAERLVNEIDSIKKNLQSQILDFEERYKEATIKGEILVQEKIFGDLAEKNLKRSYWWLLGIGLSLIVLVIVIINIFNNFCLDMKCLEYTELAKYNIACKDCAKTILIYEIIKATAYRGFILSISVLLLAFCINNYKASMHNYTVNSHKQNSLSAALRLWEKGITDKGKDDLLSQAAQSIFSHQKTGYSGKENDSINSNALLHLINSMKDR